MSIESATVKSPPGTAAIVSMLVRWRALPPEPPDPRVQPAKHSDMATSAATLSLRMVIGELLVSTLPARTVLTRRDRGRRMMGRRTLQVHDSAPESARADAQPR